MAILFALVATIFVILWGVGKNSDDSYMGGLNFNKQLANFHPVFMTAGMLFFGISSMVTYRIVDLPKAWAKQLHGVLHLAALVCIVLGLYSVFASNNFTNKHEGGGHYANLYSAHSIVGIATISLYSLNYFLGALFFLTNLVSNASKRLYLSYHVFLGLFSLFMVLASIESGILDLQGFVGCSIEVDSMNLNPASTYHELNAGCKLGNGAAVLSFLAVLFAWLAMFDYMEKSKKDQPLQQQEAIGPEFAA